MFEAKIFIYFKTNKQSGEKTHVLKIGMENDKNKDKNR